MRATRHNTLKLALSVAIAFCAGSAGSPGVLAQNIGGPSQPAVEVDLGVLDELGRGNRSGAVIPPGLFPSPRQAGTGAAFEPPQPAARAAPTSPPTNVPVVRPASGPVLAAPAPSAPSAGRTGGVKEARTVRAPAEAAVSATSEPVGTPAAKETVVVRPPAESALEATAAAEPAPTQASEAAEPAEVADAEAASAPETTESVSPSETAQVASTEQAPAVSDSETTAGTDEETASGPAIELPELNIPSTSRAAQLADGDAGETVQVQVEAIPPPAPRDLTQQRADSAEGESAAGESDSQQATAEPTVIDGIAVPDSDTLDELEESAEQVAETGLPPVDAPALAVPAPDGAGEAASTGETTAQESGVTRVQSTQVAAIPGFEDLRILFSGADAAVGPQGTALIMGLSQRLNRDESLRLQIRAYAGGTPEAATQARRLSLDRALAVRSMLIDQGVRGTRIDIRALGNSAPEEPRDRVDIIVE